MKKFLWIFVLLSFAFFLPSGKAIAKDHGPAAPLPLAIQQELEKVSTLDQPDPQEIIRQIKRLIRKVARELRPLLRKVEREFQYGLRKGMRFLKKLMGQRRPPRVKIGPLRPEGPGRPKGTYVPRASKKGTYKPKGTLLPQPQRVMQKKPLLWMIPGEKPVYLLGTIHLGVSAKRQLPGVVWKKFKNCDTFVWEADIHKANPAEMSKMMMLPPGKSLDRLLPKETWEHLVKDLGEPTAQALKKFQPWVVSILYLRKHIPQTAPMDMVFLGEAQRSKKTVAWLETWQSQIKIFCDIPLKESLEGLIETVKKSGKVQKDYMALRKAYLAGDEVTMARLVVESPEMKKNPKMYQALLVNRNRNWIPKIEGHIKRGNVFIAVGAGHLVGKDSVIQMLRAKGYKVIRVEGQ